MRFTHFDLHHFGSRNESASIVSQWNWLNCYLERAATRSASQHRQWKHYSIQVFFIPTLFWWRYSSTHRNIYTNEGTWEHRKIESDTQAVAAAAASVGYGCYALLLISPCYVWICFYVFWFAGTILAACQYAIYPLPVNIFRPARMYCMTAYGNARHTDRT